MFVKALFVMYVVIFTLRFLFFSPKYIFFFFTFLYLSTIFNFHLGTSQTEYLCRHHRCTLASRTIQTLHIKQVTFGVYQTIFSCRFQIAMNTSLLQYLAQL